MLLGKPIAFAGPPNTQEDAMSLIFDCYSEELKKVAAELSVHVIGTRFAPQTEDIMNWEVAGPDTLEMARKLIPLADEQLQRCAEESGIPDLTWTRSQVSDVPVFFEGDAAVDAWCRTNNLGLDLTGCWELVSVEKETLRLLRRSKRLNPGQWRGPET